MVLNKLGMQQLSLLVLFDIIVCYSSFLSVLFIPVSKIIYFKKQ